MRIFKFSKENNHGNDGELFEVKITKDKEFKSVLLTNPTDSNCIYIIDGITLINKLNLNVSRHNEVRFYGYENFKSVDSDFSYEMEGSDKLLLHKTSMIQDSINNLIEEDYFLVLPGGALSIEFPNEPRDVSFNLVVAKEML